MEYRITDRMLKVQDTKVQQLAVIQYEVFIQKYKRPPTLTEFFSLDDEILAVAEAIFQAKFVKEYGLEGVI